MNSKLKSVLFVVVGLIALGTVFYFLKPAEIHAPVESSTNATSSASLAITEKVFDLDIRDGVLYSGPEIINVTEGDTVVINISVNAKDEFHLHGYDKSLELTEDTPNTLTFTANLTGRFEYELEYSKLHLGVLEVLPK